MIDNIEDKKDRQNMHFIIKHLTARIYEKIRWIKCQLVVDTETEISVYTKPMIDLLKLKLKADKTMTVIAINEVKQKSLRNTKIVTV